MRIRTLFQFGFLFGVIWSIDGFAVFIPNILEKPSSPKVIDALKAEETVEPVVESKSSWIENVVKMMKEVNLARNCADPQIFRIHWRDCLFKKRDLSKYLNRI